MTSLTATLQIDGSADLLWALITNFAGYADWNRLVPTIRGEPRLNARLKLVLAPAGRRPIALRARVLVAARNRELRWCGRAWLPGLLTVEHGFRIEQRADGCRLHHGMMCSGWLAGDRLLAALREGFDAMSDTLQARALRVAAAAPPVRAHAPTLPIAQPDNRPRTPALRAS
jgi:hypothetical protein